MIGSQKASEQVFQYDSEQFSPDDLKELGLVGELASEDLSKEHIFPITINDEINSSGLSQQQQLDTFLRTFQDLDQNHLGKIKKTVMQNLIMYTGDNYDKNKIRQEIEKCQDEISFQRFTQIFQNAEQHHDHIHNWLFSLYDQESKGFINEVDLERASAITGIDLTQEEIQQMLLAGPSDNQQNHVDLESFKGIMGTSLQFF